ncbi:hypothetical protein PYW07_012148 [Mythimna separata]|uniref:THAP-type domain-containing protein n=1 Tax=Mythimna separata TaxID=271217 RepID=A0AAD8DNT9_MYTSE|nr:hypothetical protein PYW07_008575 [Mythimna separata]KAJ8720105.1 hypothetical protein PYW07_012148 [Mythimna separata]
MVKTCCIKTCKSESYSGCGVSFHRFPSKEEMKQKWLDVIPEPIKITKNSVVCSLHFNPADFLMAKSRRV